MSRRLAGIVIVSIGAVALVVAGRFLSTGQVGRPGSIVVLLLGLAVAVTGLVLALRQPALNIKQGHAAFHVPGFNPTHAAKHIAIEGKTGRLWVRDNQRGERVVEPEQLLAWRVHFDDEKYGIEVTTDSTEEPILFARTGERRESADEWVARIAESRQKS
jgi:hypothetical protein